MSADVELSNGPPAAGPKGSAGKIIIINIDINCDAMSADVELSSGPPAAGPKDSAGGRLCVDSSCIM